MNISALSSRDRQVAQLLIDGYSDEQIAARLGVSPDTVRKSAAAILQKTGSRNRPHLAARWIACGYDRPGGR